MINKPYNIFKRKFFTAFSLIFVVFLLIITVFLQQNLYINTTKSLPLGIYKLDSEISELKKGDIILFCLNDNVALSVSKLNILSHGNCPFNLAPIGKTIVAIPNDEIIIDDRGVTVNGQYLNSSKPKALPKMNPIKLKTVLKTDEYIVISQKVNSFDSRYFGIVKRNEIKGRIAPKIIIPQ